MIPVIAELVKKTFAVGKTCPPVIVGVGMGGTKPETLPIRMQTAFSVQAPLPMNFTNQLIFYAVPCPTKPGRTMGSIAPTTNMRMTALWN